MKKNDLLKNICSVQLDVLKLNMHLDIFPEDTDSKESLKNMSQKLNALLTEYETNFDSLSYFNSSYIEDPEIWTSDPWPLNYIE